MTSAGRRPGTPAAERKRQQRERERNLFYQTPDWRVFTDLATLPQKAGCQPHDIRRIILKELVDNALDAGADATLDHADSTWIVSDNGPGLDPIDVPRLFAVNRPLDSTKLRRLPLRGMLGNGLRVVAGAVAATEGALVVSTRGHRLTLAVCPLTGKTTVVSDEAIPHQPGLTVAISMGRGDRFDSMLARGSIEVSKIGKTYDGPSSPWWYGGKDLHKLFMQVTPADTTVGTVCRSLGLDYVDDRAAPTLDREQAEIVLAHLRADTAQVAPERLGFIGQEYRTDWPGYARKTGTSTTQAGACIPFVVEAWAFCSQPLQKGQGNAQISLLLNRSMTAVKINAHSWPGILDLRGCDLHRNVKGPGTGNYKIILSVIAPYVQLATDGKEPALSPFSEAIAEALRKACGAAHRAMHRPASGTTIKDAACYVMEKAYRIASGGGRYPANARQIMYAARPDILQLTGKDKLDAVYFTQTLLPDFIEAYGKTKTWNVVYDDRGTFIEPHTRREVPLGTIAVREYLGDRAPLYPAVDVTSGGLCPTSGPLHRYSAVLFVEKEGFTQLLRVARLAERFDIAIMSSKGMSTTAARELLDRLATQIDMVLVLHDFDVAGFSICGTLSRSGRRYTFTNRLPVFDIGLRLQDVEAMGLQSEPVRTKGDWAKREATLRKHRATDEEIDFLRTQRVELNAMPADMFVAFLERALIRHGVEKVLPDVETLEHQARRAIEQRLGEKLFHDNRARLQAEAATVALPEDLDDQVKALLKLHPEIPWDQAVTQVVSTTGGAP